MKKLLILTIILAALGTAGWYFLSQSAAARIAVIQPVHGPAVQAVYATGTVEPSVMIPIASRNTARLTQLLADEGQTVEQGQLLAQLEDEDLKKTLKELQAKADLAEKDYERKATLIKRGAASRESLDQAESERDAAQAAVARTEAQLGFLKLTAPEKGRIIRRDGEVGQLIPANQAVFWMSCCAPYRIAAEVDEEDIALIVPGQPVFIRADAFPGKIFNGGVYSITPKGDPVARSYRVRIGLDDDTPLMIGMTAEVNIITNEHANALLVPAEAVMDGKVWTVEEGLLKLVPVETSIKTGRAIEITSGVDKDILVVRDAASVTGGEGKPVSTVLQKWEIK